MQEIRRATERGAVTAEVAMAIPVLLATMLLGLWLAGVVIANIRCIDAARDTARAVARGESRQTAEQQAARTAPAGARISITRSGSEIHVMVTTETTPSWPLLSHLPAIQTRATATIHAEPSSPYP